MNLALDNCNPRRSMCWWMAGGQIAAYPQHAAGEGRCRSYSIAAASVLAKVTRDRLMVEYDKLYPGYGFADHKGYGTPEHLAAITAQGPCPIHRRSFAPFRPVAIEMELFDLQSQMTGSNEPFGNASRRGAAARRSRCLIGMANWASGRRRNICASWG